MRYAFAYGADAVYADVTVYVCVIMLLIMTT